AVGGTRASFERVFKALVMRGGAVRGCEQFADKEAIALAALVAFGARPRKSEAQRPRALEEADRAHAFWNEACTATEPGMLQPSHLPTSRHDSAHTARSKLAGSHLVS